MSSSQTDTLFLLCSKFWMVIYSKGNSFHWKTSNLPRNDELKNKEEKENNREERQISKRRGFVKEEN